MKSTTPNPKLCPLSQAISFSEDMLPVIDKAIDQINKLLRNTPFPKKHQMTAIVEHFSPIMYDAKEDDLSPDLVATLKYLENIKKQLSNLYAIKKFDWANCIHQGKNK